MPNLSITATQASDLTNQVEDWEVGALQVDRARDQDETEWLNSNWTTYWGYFNEIPELKSAIILKAVWIVGKGYTTDIRTRVILDHISGWGKDSFEDILLNMEVIKRVGGDFFAEIVRDDDGLLLNLKPIDPGSMKIIVNRKGVIIRYEQIDKTDKNKATVNKWKPEQMFHLSYNRFADQIHGISDIQAVEKVIKANAEGFADIQKSMHWQSSPIIMFKLGIDDPTKIDEFVLKMDKAIAKGENIYIPNDENTVSFEPIKADISPVVMVWRDELRNTFYRTIGLPQIVPGGGGQSTESESKVIYVAFENIVAKDQLALERQIWEQLRVRIKLVPPTTLLENLKNDQSKDASQGLPTASAEVGL